MFVVVCLVYMDDFVFSAAVFWYGADIAFGFLCSLLCYLLVQWFYIMSNMGFFLFRVAFVYAVSAFLSYFDSFHCIAYVSIYMSAFKPPVY
jgi:hypothetical protein